MTTDECSRPVELTILMPCLNEARTLAACIRKAKAFLVRAAVNGEILVADNGSNDGSQAIAANLGARVIPVSERGYGAALIGGIRAARGRYVIMGDADDSYDFSELDAFLEKLRRGSDLVMGNRFRGGIAEGAMPWHHRYFGNPVLSFIGRLLFPTPVRDFHCGLRGFNRDSIASLGLVSQGMEFASEMVVKATLAGMRVDEVPTTLSKDGRDRPPHLRSFRDGWRHLRFLLLHSPKWVFLYPALACMIVGALAQAALYAGPVVFSAAIGFDVHSMLYTLGLVTIGLQAVILWIIAQYSAWRNGVLPSLPEPVKWIGKQRIEYGLAIGALLFAGGFLVAAIETSFWASAGFGALDPRIVMRPVIASVTMMVAGAQVAFGAAAIGVLRLKEGAGEPAIGTAAEARKLSVARS